MRWMFRNLRLRGTDGDETRKSFVQSKVNYVNAYCFFIKFASGSRLLLLLLLVLFALANVGRELRSDSGRKPHVLGVPLCACAVDFGSCVRERLATWASKKL